jgi:hypothetical protein
MLQGYRSINLLDQHPSLISDSDEFDGHVDFDQPIPISISISVFDFKEPSVNRRSTFRAGGKPSMKDCNDLKRLSIGPFVDVDGTVKPDSPIVHFLDVRTDLSLLST